MDRPFLRINRREMLGAALTALSLPSPPVAAGADQPGVKSETLLHTSSAWNDVPYRAYPRGAPELIVLRVTVPAHGEFPWHTHPMPAVGYILSGEITVEDKRGSKRHFSAGQAIPETLDTVHRGVVGDTPAVFIVFYAGAKDMPLSIPRP
jgi:quercetin dioxygenase-like cupin family protein